MAADSSDFRQTVPIYLAIILPLIGMTILAAWSIGSSLAAYRVAVTLKEEVILSTDASRLAHELQKERGMSVGYIGSAGQAFGPQLKDQRALTDQMVAEVGARVSADDFAHVSVEAQIRTAERADRVSAALKALAAHRKSVDAMAFSGPEAAGFYTAVIMDLLSLPDDPIIDGQTGELERDVAMYQALLMAKEFAGRERAAGSAGFGAGEFSPQAYGRMVGLLQNQNYLLGRVSKLATQEEKKLVDAALSSPAAKNLAEYREIASKSLESGDVGGVTGPEWFAASTAFLGELSKLERSLANAMVDHMNAVADRALWFVVGQVVGAVAIVFAIGTWGMLFVHKLISALIGLRNAILKIARAEQGIEVPGTDRNDMVGQIASSLVTICDSGAQAKRVQAAVENTEVAIVVADQTGAVRYENKAFTELVSSDPATYSKLVSGGAGERDISSLIAASDAARSDVSTGGTQKLQLTENGEILEVMKSRINDADGVEIGFSFQIENVTGVRELEKDVMNILADIERGEFSKRVRYIDNLGFTSVAAHGINGLLETVARFMVELSAALERMAGGDLTASITSDFQGDFKTAQTTFNDNLQSLAGLVSQMMDSAGSVQSQTQPIAQSSRELAKRAEEQAAALEEINATMEDMSRSIAETAGHARDAASMAEESNTRTREGRGALDETRAAMSKIEQNSSRISDIVETVDAIAFQTNLLALNAAVEAARAGEAGKGFAVVASEVGTLAGRAGDAASQIRELIVENASDVTQGVQLMDRTKTVLSRISDEVEKLSGTVSSIRDSSVRQATGTQEVSATVTQLDTITQRNATAADESASRAEELLSHANAQMGLAQRFKTEAKPDLGSAAA